MNTDPRYKHLVTHPDWEVEGRSYDHFTLTRVTEHGVFRALVEDDDDPVPPYFEGSCPVLELDGRHCHEVVYGNADDDGLPHNASHILDHFYQYGPGRMSDAVDTFDRYLRIFHGGSAITVSSDIDRSGLDYLVYDTRAMRESWGQTGDDLATSNPEASEWQAFINQDVYFVAIQQAENFSHNGEPDSWVDVEGPIGGFYGDEHAIAGATEMLD